MRKTLALAITGALILVLGVAGVAQAVNSQQTIAVKLAHSKAGTASKPKSVGLLTVDLKVAKDPADAPFATSKTVIHFDKNLVFNGAKFPSCTEAQARTARRRARRPRSAAARRRASPSASGGPQDHGLQRPRRQVDPAARRRAPRRCRSTP